MKKTYTGGCQCGKVRYEAQAEIGDVITCNCSRCRKLGPLLSAVAKSDFKLLSDENDMTDYQFNNRTIHHPFCKTCGIQSYAYGKGPGGKEMVMLNVRCLDGVDTEQFKVQEIRRRQSLVERRLPQKAITGRPSSARHKLSDPFPTREPKPSRGVPATESQGRQI